MALLITAEQGIFLLAAILSVFSCAYVQKRDRLPAFFVLFLLGYGCGFFRMEGEQGKTAKEMAILENHEGKTLLLEGVVKEISDRENGQRLLLSECTVREGQKNTEVISGGPKRFYVYMDKGADLKTGMTICTVGEGKAPERGRNPGAFDYRLYCKSRGICGIFYGQEAEILNSGYDRFREGIRSMRMLLERQLDRISEGTDKGILKAVLLGQRGDLDEEMYALYQKNGISHLLAISGIHMSIIGMGMWKAFRAGGLGYPAAGAVSWGLLLIYGCMTGFGPSVVRALWMMGISFLASVCGRTYDLPSAMCVPAAGLLLLRPYLLTQASFQLSFLAVGAVFFPGGFLIRRLSADGIYQGLLISASIQAVTAPVILFHSFEFPLYGVILNLLVIPLMTYVVVSGGMGLAFSAVWLSGGRALLGGAHYILKVYEISGELVQRLPGASLVLGRPSGIQIICFYMGILAGVRMSGRYGKRCLLLWAASLMFLFPVHSAGLSVTFLDVGQGDGIFLQAHGKNMLVDCGSSGEKELGENCLVPFLKSRGISRLDTVVVSHGDWDHISAIRYILEAPEPEISVKRLMMPKAGEGQEIYMALETLAKKHGAAVVYAKSGDEFSGFLGKDVKITCLHPGEGKACENRNEESLVLEIRCGGFGLLLTGDVEEGGERAMEKDRKLAPVTVLKAAHHGSDTSSKEEFIRAVNPLYVVLSYGEGNRYGHPAPDVVERLLRNGARILKTAEMGAIEVRTDGKRMKVSGWLDRSGGI